MGRSSESFLVGSIACEEKIRDDTMYKPCFLEYIKKG